MIALVRSFAVVWLLCFSAPQTQTKTDAKKTQQSASDLALLSEQILDLSSSVPPELAAYAQLKVVEAKGISKPEEQMTLIESAYSLAGESPYPVRLIFVGGNLDTRAGFLSYALDQDLDTLSLRAQAVQDMLKIDPERARELFQQMRPLTLANRSCSDALIYAPSIYYKTAGEIFKRGFSQEEQAKGLPADFLESIFREVSHPSEVAAAANLLRNLDLDAETQARAEAAFARAISSIRGDDRSYTFTRNMFTQTLFRITRNPGPAHRSLLEGARAYLVTNESGERCADNVKPAGSVVPTSSSGRPDLFTLLNQLFQRYEVPTINSNELKPSSIGNRSQNDAQAYWKSPVAQRFQTDAKALRFSPEASDKTSMQWQERAEAFLTALRGWTDAGSEPSAEDLYIEKATLYSDVIGLAPITSSIYDEALNDYVGFLSTPPRSDYIRLFWLWSIRSLVMQSRHDRATAQEAQKKLEAAIRTAPNPPIALYGYLLELERMQRSSFGRGYNARQ